MQKYQTSQALWQRYEGLEAGLRYFRGVICHHQLRKLFKTVNWDQVTTN